ncbi:hypothetical protein [Sporosarcina pasteurii]|uniref:Uncharacterized protein n=1 Tax=Sporosarcina pasteurii TaxID=1474 RepID=A0A380BDS1_SPOPA|nr:hypothetical protein [Sporosarcina pasteurii]MDS9472884.1 hypothetical protein [Sporosarcina pasteurii]QBQ06432.1 hypothetical protein E2C16_12465 [Sporosarcina pasteurii]SUI98513.1 Uncharacterised protein [Sporosarcina pasteurii]
MIRKGRFAITNSKEYELISYRRQYYLKSKDILDLESGFTVFNGFKNEFIKKICLTDLDHAYEVFPYAILKSYRFSIEGINAKTGKVTLVTSNPFVQKKISVKSYRSGEYIVELPLKDIIIKEERIPILGFENIHAVPFGQI